MVGVFNKKYLPSGSDGYTRTGLSWAIKKIAPYINQDKDLTITTGFGVTKNQAERILAILMEA